MMQYEEIEMYDTEIRTYGKKYGNHVWGLLPNSIGIKVVKCINCKLARLHLMGFDKEVCQPSNRSVNEEK